MRRAWALQAPVRRPEQPLALPQELRASPREPQPPALEKLARVLHIALLAAIAVLLFSGPLAVWSGGRAINVFDWFALPSPMGEVPALHKALEIAHGVAAKVMLFSLAAHVLAALKHALVDRDGTLWRIFGRAPAAQ